EALPSRIEALEAELHALHGKLSEPDFYKGDPAAIRATTDRIRALEAEVDQGFQRWEALAERA
ncbi:MAG TPA: hypothetical protein VLA43_05205, partial [Longimicrobiales bacterium]|nr:hypothetical protein [Longimicrobiales bacterium]